MPAVCRCGQEHEVHFGVTTALAALAELRGNGQNARRVLSSSWLLEADARRRPLELAILL
jgi:hypothetical protein